MDQQTKTNDDVVVVVGGDDVVVKEEVIATMSSVISTNYDDALAVVRNDCHISIYGLISLL